MSAVCLEERHAFGLARLEVDQLEEFEPGAVVDADRDSPLGGGGKADEPIPHGILRHCGWACGRRTQVFQGKVCSGPNVDPHAFRPTHRT